MRLQIKLIRSKCKHCKRKLSKSGMHFCDDYITTDYTFEPIPKNTERVRINGVVYRKENATTLPIEQENSDD